MSREELKQLRERMGFTQERFAAELGIAVRTVIRWERGEWPVPEHHVRHIRLLAEKEGAA